MRRERLLRYSAILAMCVAIVALGAGDHTAPLHLLPLLALIVPLVLGRYPGERLLLRLVKGRRPHRAKPLAQCRPNSRQVRVPRRVIAWSLACRPPPAPASGA